MVEITTNTKTLELNGEEVHVHFTSGFPYFWLRNDGSYTVQMSLSPNISEGKDGVIEVPAGSSAGTMHGFNDTSNDLYLLGKGKVQVMGTYTPENPFRKARKGGGGNAGSNILPHSEGLAAYFDYSKNVSETGWTDIVSGATLEVDFNASDDFITPVSANADIPIILNNPYTFYAVFKQNIDNSAWAGVLTNQTNDFGIYANRNKIAVYDQSTRDGYTTDISALSYHVCAITFYNGLGSLYIDGTLTFTRANNVFANAPYFITAIADYKMIAVCNNAVHGSRYVLENTEYLAEKYGIEI